MTSGVVWAARSWLTYASSISSDMRMRSPGYSASFERKKQYVQSRLQIAPVGLARRWNDGGAAAGRSVVDIGGAPGGRSERAIVARRTATLRRPWHASSWSTAPSTSSGGPTGCCSGGRHRSSTGSRPRGSTSRTTRSGRSATRSRSPSGATSSGRPAIRTPPTTAATRRPRRPTRSSRRSVVPAATRRVWTPSAPRSRRAPTSEPSRHWPPTSPTPTCGPASRAGSTTAWGRRPRS